MYVVAYIKQIAKEQKQNHKGGLWDSYLGSAVWAKENWYTWTYQNVKTGTIEEPCLHGVDACVGDWDV